MSRFEVHNLRKLPVFTEAPIVTMRDQKENENPFDIVFHPDKKCKDGIPHIPGTTICFNCYDRELADKMLEVPRLRRQEFLDYQCEKRNDVPTFLNELEDFLIDNEDTMDGMEYGVASSFIDLIKEKRQELQPTGAKTIKVGINDLDDLFGVLNKATQVTQFKLPDDFSLTKLAIKADRLDIYQTAILFYLLRNSKAVINYTDQDLAKFAHYLTGHSEQNLRTEKGFSQINSIMEDNRKGEDFYNLKAVRSFLEELIEDIDSKISS